jgi:uncharacterized membrane protein
VSFLQKHLEDPVRFKRIKRLFYLGLALIVLAEVVAPLLFHGGHHHFAFEGWPAFGSLYGLISCVLIIVVSKFIGKRLLMRKEDYYDS